MVTLKYFMWGYQHHYRISVQLRAESIFREIHPKLKPKVFLVGFLEKDLRNFYPVCLEPADCGINVENFRGVKNLSQSIFNKHPKKDEIRGSRELQRSYLEYLKKECYIKAVQTVIDNHFEPKGRRSFLSWPVPVGAYEVIVALQFDKDAYEQFDTLAQASYSPDGTMLRERTIPRSLVESTVFEFLRECYNALCRPHPGRGKDIESDNYEIIRRAGIRLMERPAAVADGEDIPGLFETCNYISSLRYEGGIGVGKMIICKQDHPNISHVIKLSTPVSLSDHRSVRKLLEISSDDLHLYSDGSKVRGFVELLPGYDAQKEDLFIIEFAGHYKWRLSHDAKTLMLVQYGIPQLPRSQLGKEQFVQNISRIFEEIEEDRVAHLWTLVRAAMEQKHGTIVIITDNAATESERLAQQAINITPLKLTEDLIPLVTSIDGALMLDLQGNCHSMGVILDGVATRKGTSARGSRFNSALRYIEQSDSRAVAVIVSEDGMVDMCPHLRPRIRKNLIEKQIDILRANAKLDQIEYHSVLKPLQWLDQHRFYLDGPMCDELNDLRATIKSKLKMEAGMTYLNFPSFRPHEEMDESYFID